MEMESKISPYPTCRTSWPDGTRFVRFTTVRWLASIAFLLAPLVARAAPPSNPAFLGITLDDARNHQLHMDGCLVLNVNEFSGAKDAGVREHDIIHGIDGTSVATCAQLSSAIVGHQPGDTVRLEISRLGERVIIQPTLSTRAEVLHRRWVGHPMESVEARDLDDGHALDLGDSSGHTSVLGWFSLTKCSSCASVLRRVASALDNPRRTANLHLLAVTEGTSEELAGYRKGLAVGSPVATVPDEFWRRAMIGDDRVYIMVVDAHGIVRFIAPISADADDIDAAIDEVVAAAQQAEHARTARAR
jgi:hypothetical protein